MFLCLTHVDEFSTRLLIYSTVECSILLLFQNVLNLSPKTGIYIIFSVVAVLGFCFVCAFFCYNNVAKNIFVYVSYVHIEEIL